MTFKVGDRVHYFDGVVNDHFYGIIQYHTSEGFRTKWFWKDGTSLSTTNMAQDLVYEGASAPSPKGKIISDGGPSDFYNFPGEWQTFNDFIEHKSKYQWKEHSFHLGNIGKAICRWGDKDGTTIGYDAKKIIYSAARVLKSIIGVDELRKYLQKLLDDPQFKGKN